MIGSRTREPSPWAVPDAGTTPTFIPPLSPAYGLGGLLNPLPPREVPVRRGLLDPTVRLDFQDPEQRGTGPRLRRQDLPEILRDVPPGREGGLIGAMLAEYVESDEALNPLSSLIRGPSADGWTAASVESEPVDRPASLPPGMQPSGPGSPPEPTATPSAPPHPVFEGWLRGLHPLGDSFSDGPQPQDNWVQSLDAPTQVEARPDGSMWEIRGPVSAMVRPPDDALAHYQTQPQGSPSTERPSDEELRAIRDRFQSLVAEGRGHGYYFAADNLNHFLEGSGAPRFYDPNWLRSIPKIHAAESRVRQHFEDWMTGRQQPEAREELVEEDLLALQEEQSFSRSSRWDGKFNTNPIVDYLGEPDLFLAVGESNVKGRGDFTFLGQKDGRIRFEGMVDHSWEDPYDWDKGYKWGKEGFTPLPTVDDPTRVIRHADAVRLQDHGGAKPFLMSSQWRQGVEGTLRNIGGRLILESARWTDND